MRKFKLILLWAYFSEFVLAGLVYAFLRLIFTSSEVESFIFDSFKYLIIFFCALMAITTTTYFNFQQTTKHKGFDIWLTKQGHYSAYRNAYLWVLCLYLIECGLFIVAGITQNKTAGQFTFFLLIYAVINIFTLLKNSSELTDLEINFRTLAD
jgi:hypothetical protein